MFIWKDDWTVLNPWTSNPVKELKFELQDVLLKAPQALITRRASVYLWSSFYFPCESVISRWNQQKISEVAAWVDRGVEAPAYKIKDKLVVSIRRPFPNYLLTSVAHKVCVDRGTSA